MATGLKGKVQSNYGAARAAFAAGLIRSKRKGVELIDTTRCAELQDRFEPMLQAILGTCGR